MNKGEAAWLFRVPGSTRLAPSSRQSDPPCGYDELPMPKKNARLRYRVFSVSFGDAWMPGPPSASVRVRGLRRGLLRHSPALCPRSIPSTSCPGSTGAIRTFGIAFRSEEALVG